MPPAGQPANAPASSVRRPSNALEQVPACYQSDYRSFVPATSLRKPRATRQ